MAQVVFEQLRKVFGQVVAVEALDLTIEDGAFVSLLGPSGCGKTTTLRMLAGLEQPTGGTVRIGGKVVNEVPPSERDVAMVFQSYALYPHMTVKENVTYPLAKRRVAEPARGERVRATLQLLQLTELADRKPRQLSGGQQQRVALGRALVRDPAVFLLDEPLSNLDAKLRATMRAELIELHRTIGRTMVYVTHDQLEAMTMSTRIAVMHNGILQQYAKPTDVYRRPANAFVAGFTGTPPMNLIEGQILMVDGDGRVRVRVGAMDVALPGGYLRDPVIPGPVSLGVRPEDVVLGSGAYGGTVKVVEPMGYESIVILEVDRAQLAVRVSGDAMYAPGEMVRFSFKDRRLHLFDAKTGARLNSDRTNGAHGSLTATGS